MKVLWGFGVFVFVMCKWVNGFLELDELNVTEVSYLEEAYHGDVIQPLKVPLTLIPGAVAKGAVCLDGSPPGYHIHHGYGSGANSWLIQLEMSGIKCSRPSKTSLRPKQNGLFINSCFAHCHSERQDTWFSDNGPIIKNKGIAQAVGDWYFDRTGVKDIDFPYLCDKSRHHLVSKLTKI